MSQAEVAPSIPGDKFTLSELVAANALRQMHAPSPATCGGPGIRKSSTCFAISIRSAGGSWTTTRSPCWPSSRPSGWKCGPPSWCSTAASTHAYRRLKEYMNNKQTWARTHAGVLGTQAGGLFLGRVRHSRVGADLFRRLGRAVGRPYQKRQRPGHSAGGHRAVLRPGLFQAAPRLERLSARRISRHQGRKRADGAGPRHRRQARSP